MIHSDVGNLVLLIIENGRAESDEPEHENG